MGNQREIRQVSPRFHLGVEVAISDGSVDSVANILSEHEVGQFYTYIAKANEDYSISNLDFGDTNIGTSPAPRFIIQSGGKMACGYEAFCEHLARVSRYLHDAQFFIGDEDCIDEFRIVDQQLNLRRVHAGGLWCVEDYLRQRFPNLG